ncbi:hypothetical protein M5G27_26915 [Pseudomonas shahriarae]|uniref:Uncharacterized protein n=1 Tax=Pseudomonas shahriarae TaxID=2745512 RepID=A0A9X4C746_9PSED|nr:hypothetical protein [Pseudomonas shahriarae]MDD1011108.1 hypothetical protein [Pseudomonas shahriarae]
MKDILLKAFVSLVVAVAVVFGHDFIKVQDSGTPIAVVNYDVVAGRATLDSPEKAEAGYEQLRASANKLAAAGFVVIDSRALTAYPPDLEVPSPVQEEDKTSRAKDE